MIASAVLAYRTQRKQTRHILLQVVAGGFIVLIGASVTAVVSTRGTQDMNRANNLRITQAQAAASASMESTFDAAAAKLGTDTAAYKTLATTIEDNLLGAFRQSQGGNQVAIQGDNASASTGAVNAEMSSMRAAGQYKRLEKLDAAIQTDVGKLSANVGGSNHDSVNKARKCAQATNTLTDLLLHPNSSFNLQQERYQKQMKIINKNDDA